MKSSFKAKVKCAQLGLKYIGTRMGFETAIESIGLLSRWKAWPQRRPTQRAPDLRQSAPEPHLHRTAFGAVQVWWWDSAHALGAVKLFAWLEVGSGKMALSRPTHRS
jgi:hypothetical protein